MMRHRQVLLYHQKRSYKSKCVHGRENNPDQSGDVHVCCHVNMSAGSRLCAWAGTVLCWSDNAFSSFLQFYQVLLYRSISSSLHVCQVLISKPVRFFSPAVSRLSASSLQVSQVLLNRSVRLSSPVLSVLLFLSVRNAFFFIRLSLCLFPALSPEQEPHTCKGILHVIYIANNID